MKLKDTEGAALPDENQLLTSRRHFVHGASLLGAAAMLPMSGIFSAASAQDKKNDHNIGDKRDRSILIGAEIAEALAVTTYGNIIDTSPFFAHLESDDQGYLRAARNEEMSHYLLEQSATNQPSPYTQFFYPPGTFDDPQTTLNVLVTLEDAFIGAYLVGVRNFSSPELRVTSARIMGIESDHRTLARLIANNIADEDGGPLETITGIQGVAESIEPPNNNGYERTLCWNRIEQVIDALTPFVNINAARAAGFDTSKVFQFEPFQPTLPNPLGEFISFKGC